MRFIRKSPLTRLSQRVEDNPLHLLSEGDHSSLWRRETTRDSIALFIVLLSFFLFTLSCSGRDTTPAAPAKKTVPLQPEAAPLADASPLILSVLPVESAGVMYKRFLPLKYFLEKTLKTPVVIRIARDFESAINDLGTGRVHMAYLDPATYCEVRARYRNKVMPLVRAGGGEGTASRSVLVSKEGSGIEKLVDVRGKRLALGTQKSSFSYLIPLAMLNDVGLGVRDFASTDYLLQEDRVALSVLISDHEVGGLSESVAEQYADDGLKIIKRSEIVPQFVLCSSNLLSSKRRLEIVKSLTSAEGRGALSFMDTKGAGFVQADDRDFDMIRVMIRNLTGRDYVEYGPGTIKVAVLPLYSAVTIYNRYDPLMRYLSAKTGSQFKLVIPRDFDDFMRVVKNREVDFSYQNPYIFALIDRVVDIRALVSTVDETTDAGDRFRGVIITRSGSAVKDIKGLRNKKVLITSPMSAGGYLSQRLFLMRQGMDTEKDMRIVDAKRQENVILGVYKGEADAGFVRESALDMLKEEIDMKKINILARTSSLPNWPFAACRKVPSPLERKVGRILLELKDREILKAAGIKSFRTASDAEFEALKRY